MNIKHKTELLSPAGSYTGMTSAIEAGADAVYLGGMKFGARAYANNFDEAELLKAIDYVHLKNKKLYLTVNTLMKEKEMRNELFSYLKPLYLAGLDGVIVQDLGIVDYIRNTFPSLPIHASTQMTVTSLPGVEFLKSLGINRVVTARELTLNELKYITSNTDVEIEAFIHGAMCFCYSGQCLMSSILGGRSGNRGRCAQPCRLPYSNESGQKSAYMSLKDMCTYPILGELLDSGIASFKIEGRMKSPEYTAGVTSIYRYQIDLMEKAISEGKSASSVSIDKKDMDSLLRLYSRGTSGTGYYQIQNGPVMLTGKEIGYSKDQNAASYKVKEQILNRNSKQKIEGEIFLYSGNSSRLRLKNEINSCEVTGDIVETAQNAPLSSDDIASRIRKTGNTPFEFSDLTIHMGDNIYCSVKSLNELRRNAIEALSNCVVDSFRRKDCNISNPYTLTSSEAGNLTKDNHNKAFLSDGNSLNISYSALVNTREQLKTVINSQSISTIYLERSLWREVENIKGKRVILCMPHILRQATINELSEKWESHLSSLFLQADGVLIRNLEGYEFLKNKGYGKRIITDSNLYTWNTHALNFWLDRNIDMTTVPYELNYGEIRGRTTAHSEIVVYGRIPLMITAQCMQKTMEGCAGGNDSLHVSLNTRTKGSSSASSLKGRPFEFRYITDRYNKSFPVYNRCTECYNIIYNSLPLCLIDDIDKLSNAGIRFFRYEFTAENEKETSDILQGRLPSERTRGHLSRGVE